MLSLVNLSLVTEKRFSHRHYEKKKQFPVFCWTAPSVPMSASEAIIQIEPRVRAQSWNSLVHFNCYGHALTRRGLRVTVAAHNQNKGEAGPCGLRCEMTQQETPSLISTERSDCVGPIKWNSRVEETIKQTNRMTLPGFGSDGEARRGMTCRTVLLPWGKCTSHVKKRWQQKQPVQSG